MYLNKISQNIQEIEQGQANAITNLIDLKIDEDMNKVINEIQMLRADMDSKFTINKYTTVASTVTILGGLIIFIQYFPLK